MLKPHVHYQQAQTKTLVLSKPFINGNGHGSEFLVLKSKSQFQKARKRVRVSVRHGNIKAVVTSLAKKSIKVLAVVTVKQTIGGLITSLGIEKGIDDIKDFLGKGLHIELVSSELDPSKFLLMVI